MKEVISFKRVGESFQGVRIYELESHLKHRPLPTYFRVTLSFWTPHDRIPDQPVRCECVGQTDSELPTYAVDCDPAKMEDSAIPDEFMATVEDPRQGVAGLG